MKGQERLKELADMVEKNQEQLTEVYGQFKGLVEQLPAEVQKEIRPTLRLMFESAQRVNGFSEAASIMQKAMKKQAKKNKDANSGNE